MTPPELEFNVDDVKKFHEQMRKFDNEINDENEIFAGTKLNTRCAEVLTAILAEKLAKCPKVYGDILHRKEVVTFHLEPQGNHTHTAYLVGIQPIQKPEEIA